MSIIIRSKAGIRKIIMPSNTITHIDKEKTCMILNDINIYFPEFNFIPDEEISGAYNIGHMQVTYVNAELIKKEYDLIDFIDDVSINTSDTVSSVLRYIEDEDVAKDIFCINEIFIEEEYRDRCLGHLIVDALPKILTSHFGIQKKLIVLHAQPSPGSYDEECLEGLKIRLKDFFILNGMTQIKDTPYMYRICV